MNRIKTLSLNKLWFSIASFATLLLVSGCSFTTKQSTLDPKGPVAQLQLDLFWITVWVCTFIFIVVASVLLFVVLRYRERKGDKDAPMPKQGHGNPLVELSLIVVSILLLVIIAIPTLDAIWYTHELPSDQEGFEDSKLGSWYTGDIDADENEKVLEINVYGWQWWWSFEYPQLGITTANEMVIPVDKVVKINLRAVDVIHSFWLPKIAGKVDLMPGRNNWMWIRADETGHYYGQCAEFCGEAHAYMLFRTDVLEANDFEKWVSDYQAGALAPAGFQAQPDKSKPDPTSQDDWMAWSETAQNNPEIFADDPVHEGAVLFMGKAQCIVCHSIDNSPAMGKTAPDLTQIAARKSLAAGILDNTNPQTGEIDKEKQLDNLVKWLSRSQDIKPGNLMYYREDAGLQNLKYKGITFAKLKKVGINKENLVDAGIPSALASKIADNQYEPINGISIEEPDAVREGDVHTVTITQAQLKKLTKHLTDDQFAEISDWPSQDEFRKIALFLQTLS